MVGELTPRERGLELVLSLSSGVLMRLLMTLKVWKVL